VIDIGLLIGKLMGFVISSTKHSIIKFRMVPNCHEVPGVLVYIKSLETIPLMVTVDIFDKFNTITLDVGSPFDPMYPLNPRIPMLIV
jgi:hypothetical protein